jgi:hypothetical protein
MASIPVVFFTAKGIPGEVEERVDTPAGLVAASMRAMGLGECRTDVATGCCCNCKNVASQYPCINARLVAEFVS